MSEGMQIRDVLDEQRVVLLCSLMNACDAHGMESKQACAARQAFVDGAEALIGEIYEHLGESISQNNGHWAKEGDDFLVRVPALMRLAGLKQFHFAHMRHGTFTLTDRGEMIPMQTCTETAAA